MDPNENLREQLRIAAWIADADGGDPDVEFYANHLAQLVIALNDWISRGGFLPAAWRKEDPEAE